VEGLGLNIGALAVIQQCEVVEARGGVGVIGPQRLLPDREGAEEEGLGLREALGNERSRRAPRLDLSLMNILNADWA